MAAKPFKPCANPVTVALGKDVLIWDNSEGTGDCTMTGCKPALELNTYFVPAGTAVPAKVVQRTAPAGQIYHCDCDELAVVANPKLIVT